MRVLGAAFRPSSTEGSTQSAVTGGSRSCRRGAFERGGVVTARTRLSLTIQGAMLGATTGAGIGAIVGCLATAVVGCIPGAVGGAGQGVGIGGVVGAGGWFILSFFVGEKAG